MNLKTSIGVLLMCCCIDVFSAVIMIRNESFPLEYRNDLYYWPVNNVVNPGTTLFITMDGLNKVCFINPGPQGVLEQISEVSIIIHGVKTDWNCFPYKTTVFPVRP